MHLEVKVALNFIVSYLYNKLPRRRADLFGEELERILVSRYEGHWYPEAPLRGSAFRCLHLGAPTDPVVELAAKRSGLDTEEVQANVPPELSVWIDPYEVSYQIGEKGPVKVLYLEDPPGLGGEGEQAEGFPNEGKAEEEGEECRSLGFNPDAQVFVPVGGQVSPVLLSSLSSSPTPLSATSCPGLYGFQPPGNSGGANQASRSSNASSSPSPPSLVPYMSSPPQQTAAAPTAPVPTRPLTFTTATFAATKFGSTKMKKSVISTATSPAAPQRLLSRSLSPPKHKPLPLPLPLHSSQLSPNAKEFVYPPSSTGLYFDPPHSATFAPPHSTFDPFSSPLPEAPPTGMIGSAGSGGISYVEGLGGYNLQQYSSQAFQPVVLAN